VLRLSFLFIILFPFSALGDDFASSLFKPKMRSHIQIVGSSTVYPFIAVVAESFGRESNFKTPIVESTGTGGGFKLFCSGVGYEFPDFINASRRIKNSEIEKCRSNQVSFGEIKIGYDGIVLANAQSKIQFNLSAQQIFLALAEKVPNSNGELVDNFYKKWSDINANLPQTQIAVYGPPSTSGTRDAFVELVMIDSCDKNIFFVKNYPDQKIRHKKCQIIRSDGAFIEAGENDNLIVQKLKNDKNALGIFGYSFLQENRQTIQPALIDGIYPTLQNIASRSYKISRPLYVYYKKEHRKLISGMSEFIAEIASRNTLGNEGYLLQTGLIPLSNQEIELMEAELRKNL